MSSIILSPNELHLEPIQNQTQILIPDFLQYPEIIGFIDPSHPLIPVATRREALKARYHDQLVRDALMTGHFKMVDGQPTCCTYLPVYSFMGFIFEAFFVNEFNGDKTGKGKNAYLWCTNKRSTTNAYIEGWKAIGTGHIETKMTHLPYYGYGSNADIIFIRPSLIAGQWQPAPVRDPTTSRDTTITASIQVKAVCGNERSEIVEPLKDGKYRNVITCLKHQGGKPSYTVCIEIIRGMVADGTIGYEEAIDLESRVYSPEHLGFDQHLIEHYRTYIEYWYAGRASTENFVVDAIGQEVKGFTKQGSLYVPNDMAR